MQVRFIYNQRAGTAHQVADRVRHLDKRCEVAATQQPDDIARFTRSAAEDGFDRIIIAGGDGSIHQAIDGLAPHFPAIDIAILPLGTGNDLARSLDIPVDDHEEALELAFTGTSHAIDLVAFEGAESGYFVNVASGGVGGEIAAEVKSDDKQRWGSFAYWLTAVSKISSLNEFHLQLALDDRCLELDAYGVTIANGRFLGGGFPIAPSAYLDDGLLDVTVIPAEPFFELMGTGIDIAMAEPREESRQIQFQAATLTVLAEPPMLYSLDGEPARAIEATFKVLPGVLQVVTGEDPALRQR